MTTYVIGLTGNIACGKSTVVGMLQQLGAAVIDADQVTRQLQEPGQAVYHQIVAAFGESVLREPGGPIDRPALGAVVFQDVNQLRRLEQIVHPAVHQTILDWLEYQRTHARVLVIDAIKLLEAGWKPYCQAIWVVACPIEQQLQRLMTTRGMTEAEARMRIQAQPPQAEKVALADVVIENGGSLEATKQQVLAAWHAIPT